MATGSHHKALKVEDIGVVCSRIGVLKRENLQFWNSKNDLVLCTVDSKERS